MIMKHKPEHFSTDRYLPPKFRKGGEDAYNRKGYPQSPKVKRVGHTHHLWSKKINRKFEWKGEWICQICSATVRSKTMPPIDAVINQMSSPSINTLLPISGKTVVEDIKKLERGSYPPITADEGARRLKSIGWDEIPGTRQVLRDGAEYAEFIWTGEPDTGVQSGWIQRRMDEMDRIQLPQIVRGKHFTDTYWNIKHGGRQDIDDTRIGVRFEAKMNKFESKVIKMAEQTDFAAGTAIMMSIGWSPAPGNRKDYEDGVSRVYEYTGTDDPIPLHETSFSSFVAYDEWQKRQKEKIEATLSNIEAWIHGWPVERRVEIWYPNKLEQMENVNKEKIHMNKRQEENILQRVSRTGHAIFEDSEQCPSCGSSKIEMKEGSVHCQMCSSSYKKKVDQKEDDRFNLAKRVLKRWYVRIKEEWRDNDKFGFYGVFRPYKMNHEEAENYIMNKLRENGLDYQFVHFTDKYDISIVINDP